MELELRLAVRSGQLALLELDPNVASTARNHGGEALYEAVAESCPDATLLVIDPLDALTEEILDQVGRGRAEVAAAGFHALGMCQIKAICGTMTKMS